MAKLFSHTVIVCISLILMFTTLPTFQQTCESPLYSENEATPSNKALCPIAYINLGNKCQSFTSVHKQKIGSTCSTYDDCYFTFMRCFNNKCANMLRLPGDSCVSDFQCANNLNIRSMVNLVGPKCINNKCQYYKVEKRNDGEECYVDENTNTVYDCKEGYVCYKCCERRTPEKSKCIPKVVAKKGESCSNPSTDKAIVSNFKVCDTGLYCKNMGDGSQLCTEPLAKGANCANSETNCEEGTICRQNSPIDKTMTCQKPVPYGETCVLKSDCAYSSSNLIYCYNNKCTRFFGRETNGNCKIDQECYSGYCSPATGTCAERPITSCSSSMNCRETDFCACGGKGSSNSPGKCTDNCNGPMMDVATCIYNLGLENIELLGGLGPLQYVDEESSLFTKCRKAYSRYYSCLRKSWINAGISTKGEMAGIDLDAYSVMASPLLPDGANQNQITFGILLIIIILVNLCL